MNFRHKVSNAANWLASSLKNDKIERVTDDGLQLAGKGAIKAGRFLARLAVRASDAVRRNADDVESAVIEALGKTPGLQDRQRIRNAAGWTAKVLTKGLGGAMHVGTAAGVAVYFMGQGVSRSSAFVGGLAGGLSSGVADFMTGTVDSLVLRERDIQILRARLVALGEGEELAAQRKMREIESAIRAGQRSRLFDLLTVGGMTLSAILASRQIDPDIEQAFELAYPGLAASGMSFADAVAAQSNDNLVGLLSCVKGKLFELQLVDHLNEGNLPDGLEARLAESATQAGWDIQIVNTETGVVHEYLQAKATESLSYVQQTLDKYPDIDVVSTSELHAVLTARGLAEQVRDGGILNADLEAQLADAANASQTLEASDFIPSTLGLAFIALSVLMSSRHLSAREIGQELGGRSSKAGFATFAGHAAMVVTQTWWIGLASGAGSHWLANKGRDKRVKLEALLEALAILEVKVATRAKDVTDVHLPALRA